MRENLLRTTIILILMCLLQLGSSHLKAQFSFNIDNLTNREGLSQNTVTAISIDKRGFLWIGTLNGLNQYDGTQFNVLQQEYGEELSLSDNRIRTLFHDRDGFLWAVTNTNHFNCYNIDRQSFEKFDGNTTSYGSFLQTTNGDLWLWDTHNGCLLIQKEKGRLQTKSFANELNNVEINFLIEGAGQTIYLSTHQALYRYRKGNMERVIQKSLAAMIEEAGHLYLFTRKGEIIDYHKANAETRIFPASLPENSFDETFRTADLGQGKHLIASRNGLFIFHPDSKAHLKTADHLFDGETLQNAKFLRDNKGTLWLYNNTGILWQQQTNQDRFLKHTLIPPEILSTIDLERFTILHDSRNIKWISTYGNGLFALDQENKTMVHLRNQKEGGQQLPSNYLLSLAEDKTGNIWVGTEHGGLAKITHKKSNAETFVPGDPTSERNRIVRLVFEDSKNRIWLGTKSGQIYVYSNDLKTLLWQHNFRRGLPYTMEEDAQGNFWIGTKGQGLLIMDKDFVSIYQSDHDVGSERNIYDLLHDKDKRIWIGTYGNGLYLAHLEQGNLHLHGFPELNQQQSRIRTLLEDEQGRIWVGGNDGLLTFSPDSLLQNPKAFRSYKYNRRDPHSLANNEIKTIFMDHRHQIWLGSSGGGIMKVLKGKNKDDFNFHHYNINHGLINNIVQDITEDHLGQLWISTETGLSKFDPNNQTFENIKLSDSWEGDLLSESASRIRSDGTLLFGSHLGLHLLHPEEPVDKPGIPPVYLTQIEINGQAALPGRQGSPLNQSLYNTSTINLNHIQRNINLHFALPDYLNPEANTYTYILEGYEQQWNPLTRHSYASYRNLPPGAYTFRVRAKNSLGTWSNSEARLQIQVKAPWWRSSPAIIAYSLLAAILIFGINTTIRRMDKLATAIRMEKELTAYKLQFFTNISHEFRTPLTIIQGVVHNLRKQPDLKQIREEVGFLERSTDRLMRLVEQLLEFRKLQNNRPQINPRPLHLSEFTQAICSAFEHQAKQRNIHIQLISPPQQHAVLLDEGVLDKTLHNLLSNALKFTPEDGNIEVQLRFEEPKRQIELQVHDSGPGLNADQQKELFQRFKRFHHEMPGAGIGLNLCMELITAHEGSISYRPSHLGGACFQVHLPWVLASLPESETTKSESSDWPNIIQPHRVIEHKGNTDKHILIIEDDQEIANYLQQHLSHYFQTTHAPDGKKGLSLCNEVQPDLVLCDVMMPVMNGFEVTHQLKNHRSTCHLPIILLTAYTAEEYQFKGFEAGADAYISKPFSPDMLLLRINNLLEQREAIRLKYSRTPDLKTLPEQTTNKDAQFLNAIHQLIEARLGDSSLTVEVIMETTKMSRTLFYNKIKSLTGYSPNDLIKNLRMKKAAEILREGELNVSETALAVGIEDPYYFSKCFKKQFGLPPSSFIRQSTSSTKI